MSFQEIMVNIAAENLASAAFTKVGADAAVMGSQVRGAAAGFNEVERASKATTVSLRTTAMAIASVGMMGSMIISTAEDFGILDKEAAKQARTFLHLITLIATIVRVKHYLAVVTGVAASAQTAHTAAVAANTGIVAGSTTAYMANAGAIASSSMVQMTNIGVTSIASSTENVHTASVLANTGAVVGSSAAHAVNASSVAGSTTAKIGNVLATIQSTIAEGVHAAANLISAKATWVLNAALAMKIALLTLGVGLVIATAAYMAWLATTTRDAANAQMEYNESLRQRERASERRTEEQRYEYITRRGY